MRNAIDLGEICGDALAKVVARTGQSKEQLFLQTRTPSALVRLRKRG